MYIYILIGKSIIEFFDKVKNIDLKFFMWRYEKGNKETEIVSATLFIHSIFYSFYDVS